MFVFFYNCIYLINLKKNSPFFGKPPLFLPGSWLLLLGTIAFCYSIVSIGIVYADTENEHLKIAAFILLFASFIVSISLHFLALLKLNKVLKL